MKTVSGLSSWTQRLGALALLITGAVACATAPTAGLGSGANKPGETAGDDDDDAPAKEGAGSESTELTLKNVDPATVAAGSAPSGLSITLTGTNFVRGTRVAIADTIVEADVESETTMTVMVPGDSLTTSGTLKLAAVSADDTRSNEVVLTVSANVSQLTLNPTTGVRGQSLTLTVKGTAFAVGATIVFADSDVATSRIDATTLRANVSGSLLETTGTVNVAVRQGTTLSSPATFTISGLSTTCQTTCASVGLSPGQCTDRGGSSGGLPFPLPFPFPFDFGNLFGGQSGQCGSDGCVHEGCDN